VDGNAAQVDEAVLLRHELQALHLIFNLHLALANSPHTLRASSFPLSPWEAFPP
jgi:hypothetical protein